VPANPSKKKERRHIMEDKNKKLQPKVTAPVVRSTGTNGIINSQPNGGVEASYVTLVVLF
jgi:hypothetical protein